MTVEELRRRVSELESFHADDEGAHGTEDRLRHDVLLAIRDGAENAAELADIVLKTSEIEFSRWCA